MKQQRIRMFAGPNGSGKSTMLNYFIKEMHEERLGVYLNADDIEKFIKENGGSFSFDNYDIKIPKKRILKYLKEAGVLEKPATIDKIDKLKIEDNSILFNEEIITSKTASYFASAIVSIIRKELLNENKTFTFETVMSHQSKVEFFEKAQSNGIKTYLYYIATDDPIININRVKNRVENGGHHVKEEKIEARYCKSLALLKRAIKASYRSYVYDNSGEKPQLIAEVHQGKLIFKVEDVPYWLMSALKLV